MRKAAFEKRSLPTGDVICEKQLFNLVDKIEKVKVNESEIERLLPAVFRKLDWLKKEDIIKRIVSLEFNRLLDYYSAAEEIIEPSDRSSNRRDRDDKRGERRSSDRDGGGRDGGGRDGGGSRQAEKGFTRIFINIGKMDGANPANLMGFVNDHVTGKVEIGRIDLLKNFSFFEVPQETATNVVNSFKGLFVEDRKLVVEIAQDSDNKSGGSEYSRSDRKSFDNKGPRGKRKSSQKRY